MTNTNTIIKENIINVKCIQVKQHTEDIVLKYDGTIEPTLKVPMSFLVPGTLIKTQKKIGDSVTKGEILAELDATSYLSAYNGALALQKQADDAYNRLKKVYDKGSLPEIQWEEIKSKLSQANASLSLAKKNKDNCLLKAGFSGIIGDKKFETGTNVTPGLPVYELISISEIDIKISVPENEINQISKGQTATITIPSINKTNLSGIVDEVGVQSSFLSRTYETKIRLVNPKLQLKPGMVCEVKINPSRKNNIITVPYKSILQDNNGSSYIYVINDVSNIAEKRFVQIGSFIKNDVQITSGLNNNELVVIEGQQKLVDKQLVAPILN